MEKLKKDKRGITLVALVVTIVILLILAGISINLVLGNNGIISRTEEAKNRTNQEQIKEKIMLAVSAAQIEGLGDIDLPTLNDELTKIGYTGSEITSLPVSVTIDDVTYVIEGTGTVGEETWYYDTDGNITNGIRTLQIGDYVNYSHTAGASTTPYTATAASTGTDADQTYTVTDYTGGWRVLGAEAGNILLVSESPVATLKLKGQAGYANGVAELNNICAIYGKGKYATGARSINVDDVNKITGYNPEEAKYGEGNVGEYGSEVTYSWNGTDKPSYTSINGSGTLSISHANGFDWYDNGWQHSDKADSGNIATIKSNYYNYAGCQQWGYSISKESGNNYYTLPDSESVETKLIFESDTYWLASPFVHADSNSVAFSLYSANSYWGVSNYDGGYFILFFSCGESNISEYDPGSGARAVVSLKSDIKLTENGANNWNISEDV